MHKNDTGDGQDIWPSRQCIMKIPELKQAEAFRQIKQ